MFANISLFDFGKVIFQRTKETNFILPSLRLHNARDDVRNKLEKRNVSKAERKKKKEKKNVPILEATNIWKIKRFQRVLLFR